MKSTLKAFWTEERKTEMKAIAAVNGGDYGKAMKAIWEAAGAQEEYKAIYNAEVG
jgi:hypothetical protein